MCQSGGLRGRGGERERKGEEEEVVVIKERSSRGVCCEERGLK